MKNFSGFGRSIARQIGDTPLEVLRARVAGSTTIGAPGSRVEVEPGGRLDIQNPASAGRLEITVRTGAHVVIGPNCILGDLLLYAAPGSRISVGASTGFNGRAKLLAHEAATLSIGSLCLFADETLVTVSDMHAIVEAETGERINHAADVTIEDHVWIGQRVMVLKGSHVGHDSIVAAGSIVTGALPEHSTCAGSPARPIRSGVTWRFDLGQK